MFPIIATIAKMNKKYCNKMLICGITLYKNKVDRIKGYVQQLRNCSMIRVQKEDGHSFVYLRKAF